MISVLVASETRTGRSQDCKPLIIYVAFSHLKRAGGQAQLRNQRKPNLAENGEENGDRQRFPLAE